MSLPLAGLIISLQLLRGDMDQVRRENPLIFSRGVAISRKLGFPDVIMPGESQLASSHVADLRSLPGIILIRAPQRSSVCVVVFVAPLI